MIRTRGERIFNVINIVLIALITSTCLLPFIHILAKSFSANTYLLQKEVFFWPKGFTLNSYQYVLSNPQFFRSLINSVFITVAGTVLPPLVIITVISFFYAAFRSNPIVSMAMAGMSAGVAAVICDVVYTMGRSVLQLRRVLPAVIMAAAFVAACFFDVSVIVIILLCGAAGAWDTLRRGRGKGDGEA